MQEILDNAQIFNGVDSSSLCDENKFFKRPPWKTDPIHPLDIKPQSDLTITHVNQTHDLNRVKALIAVPNDQQSSEQWLESHSIEFQNLCLTDLLKKGKRVKRPGDHKHMVFDASVINEFEYKLNTAIEVYHKRIMWLLEGTRKMFGLIKGDRVGILIDSSDANTGFGRLRELQKALLNLLDEQIKLKRNFYMVKFGTNVQNLWNVARDVNFRTLEEAKDFIREMRPSGGCNLLTAFKKVIKVKRLNSLVIIVGSCPDQTVNVISDYIQQSLLGMDLPIHAIAYDTSNHQTHDILKRIALASNGRYHCYSSSDMREIYKGSDVQLLLRESQRSLDMISKIKQMRTGMLGDALVSIENEISMEVDTVNASRFLPRPPNHNMPLNIETPNFNPRKSEDWLSENGLKAKRLNLYQVLAPDAHENIQDFVPILGKTVSSKVNGSAMQPFEWHDGTVKNMHVDMAMLYDYQKKLGGTVNIYQKRIEWLVSGSRRIWGTICEKKVILIIDISIVNRQYIVHLQHSLRAVLEQQMANKDAFNIIAFGSHPKMWKPSMVPPTPENLQAAWRWVLHLEANGSRNMMSAFRASVENNDDIEAYGGPQGIYILTSGIPDQEEDVICTFINECCVGNDLKVHTILFGIDDFQEENEMPSRYANVSQTSDYLRNVAKAGNGRFHWFKENGIVQSDDITAITKEMENAVHFSQRCTTLVNSLKDRYPGNKISAIEPPPPQKHLFSSNEYLKYPKQTALSLARIQKSESGTVQKSLNWRPPTLKPDIPGFTAENKTKGKKNKKQKPKQNSQVLPFYTEDKGNVGMVYKKYPKTKTVRKSVPEPILPEAEEAVTSSDWLKKYGLKKLKLHLNRYIKGPVCVHEKSKVKTTGSTVHAKWFCNIFPSVDVNNEVRHIDMTETELDEYETQVTRVTKRYLERMQWLLSGSRRLFGTILENNVVILIDISGSMSSFMGELKKQFAGLIWEQFHKNKINFNLIAFSDQLKKWQDEVTEPEDVTCEDAVAWVSSLQAHGCTGTLDVLREVFTDENAEAVYLISDGKPDTSIKLTLSEANRLNQKRIPIHTISLNCDDRENNNFLKELARQSTARFG